MKRTVVEVFDRPRYRVYELDDGQEFPKDFSYFPGRVVALFHSLSDAKAFVAATGKTA
jgi:hypothetical protein